MAELAGIMEKYEKYRLCRFIIDYLRIRDKCLEGRQLTRENLQEVMPRIKANLELRLIQLNMQSA